MRPIKEDAPTTERGIASFIHMFWMGNHSQLNLYVSTFKFGITALIANEDIVGARVSAFEGEIIRAQLWWEE